MSKIFSLVFSVVISVLVVWGVVSGATTITSNIVTGGTLSVTGVSTMTGLTNLTGGSISSGSSTIAGPLQIAGMIQASSTATSTFANGIRLSAGCFFDVNGVCMGATTSTSGVNTFTGLQNFTVGFVADATSSIAGTLSVGRQLQASSTLLVTGLSSLYGGFISSASSTVANDLAVNGNLNASSTLTVTGVSTFVSLARAQAGLVSTGSSTVTGLLNVTGVVSASNTIVAKGDILTQGGNIVASSTNTTLKGVGVATSTPAAEFAASGSGTTTLYLSSTAGRTAGDARKGGCIELQAASSTDVYRLYIGADDIATTTANSAVGSNNGRPSGIFAVWELGSCK